MRYSAFAIVREALRGNRHWAPVWRDPAPKPAYDVVIIGGGGHGLATAYYLAKKHGIANVAVLEKGYLGGGNVGRNTTIVRSNYLLPGNVPFYEWSLKLWEGLEQDLNYNAMMSASAASSTSATRTASATPSPGAATPCACTASTPSSSTATRCGRWRRSSISTTRRFPIRGGLLQRRGGTARHDAVAWGYARAADRRGVDLIQNCEVTGLPHRGRARRRRRDDARADPRPARSAWRSPATPRASRRWPACGCRSRATSCRPSCPRR